MEASESNARWEGQMTTPGLVCFESEKKRKEPKEKQRTEASWR